MKPPFRFLYVFLAAAVTYGALFAARAPRFDGPHRGWVYGHEHGFRGNCGQGHNRAGWGCGYNDRSETPAKTEPRPSAETAPKN